MTAPGDRCCYETPLADNLDCVTCGACCFGQNNYVQVFADDVARLGPEQTATYVAEPVSSTLPSVGRPAEAERFMKMKGGHCSALRTPEPNQPRWLCAVYEDRPTLCRAFERGSASCLAARARRGL